MLTGLLLAIGWIGQEARATTEGKDDFGPLVKLAPFVVNGQPLSVSVHARSARDRHYAERFAEDVIKVVCEAVTPETGKGLVIIGRKGEPHPIVFFRKFQALAAEGKLDPAIAARAPELTAMLNHWQKGVNEGNASDKKNDGEVDLEFEKIVTALPLPLEGIGAKLYQLAWAEDFDDAKVAAKLQSLQPGDLERRDLFARFDWVFYLPPKGAFDHVVDDLISEGLKDDDTGFFTRTMIKGALIVVKPKIRHAIESLRQGLLFMSVVQTRTHYTDADVTALTDVYVQEQLSSGKSSHERLVKALRERTRLIAPRSVSVE